jgi:hypothetical protein
MCGSEQKTSASLGKLVGNESVLYEAEIGGVEGGNRALAQVSPMLGWRPRKSGDDSDHRELRFQSVTERMEEKRPCLSMPMRLDDASRIQRTTD